MIADARKRLGANMRAALKRTGFGPTELAARMEVSRQNIQQWQSGKCAPLMGSLLRFCTAVEATPAELFDGVLEAYGAER